MSTRPKPRPRPRPKAVEPTGNTSQSTSSSDNNLQTPGNPVPVDDDDRFIKNRWRTTDDWKRLEQLSEANEKKETQESSDDDSGVEMDSLQTKHKKTGKSGKKDKDKMPDWTKSIDAIVIPSDDELDERILQVENAKTDPAGATRQLTPTKKRQRSRSHSITPPPQLPSVTIQHAKETVRRLLGTGMRSPSPIDVGDDSIEEDSFVLDPELASIARKAEMEVLRQSSTPGPGRSSSPIDVGGPENVVLKVNWKPHPLNPNAKPQVWGFKMRRNDAFRELFNEIADMASILVDSVIVSYEGKRIYPSASPHGIGVWAEAELDACDKITYEYIRSNRFATPSLDAQGPSPADTTHPPLTELEDDSVAGTEVESGSEDDDTIRLTFRSGSVRDITLTVRPTTKCSAILKAYLRKAGLSDKYPEASKAKGKKGKALGPALAVDGDKLDPNSEIGTADLEDGDQVEVVGLSAN